MFTKVVVTGELPDMCHTLSGIKVNKAGNKISIKAYAQKHQKFLTACPMVTIPFAKLVNLGHLQKGDYALKFRGYEDVALSSFSVSEAPSHYRDNFFYAQVNDISVSEDLQEVAISMALPSDCVAFDRIDLDYKGGNVLGVLPILSYTGDNCNGEPQYIKEVIRIPQNVTARPLLLHVRTMNGQSINQVLTESQSFRVL